MSNFSTLKQELKNKLHGSKEKSKKLTKQEKQNRTLISPYFAAQLAVAKKQQQQQQNGTTGKKPGIYENLAQIVSTVTNSA